MTTHWKKIVASNPKKELNKTLKNHFKYFNGLIMGTSGWLKNKLKMEKVKIDFVW